MVKVVYICEKCEETYGRPQVTKDKKSTKPPMTACEYCGYTGRKHKQVIGRR